jgi:hypothetical protein
MALTSRSCIYCKINGSSFFMKETVRKTVKLRRIIERRYISGKSQFVYRPQVLIITVCDGMEHETELSKSTVIYLSSESYLGGNWHFLTVLRTLDISQMPCQGLRHHITFLGRNWPNKLYALV